MNDKINPAHYDGDTCMRLIAQITALMRGKEAAAVAMAVKHIYRAGRKPQENASDDYRKAGWYLGWLEEQWKLRGESEQMEHEGLIVKRIRDILSYTAPECRVEKLWGLT